MSSCLTESESVVSCHCDEGDDTDQDPKQKSCGCNAPSSGLCKCNKKKKVYRNTEVDCHKKKKKKKCMEKEKKKRRSKLQHYMKKCRSPRKLKKPFPLIRLTWPTIWNMILVSYVINGFHVIYGILLIILGCMAKDNCADFINLVTCNDGTYISYFILLAGAFSVPINLGFFFISWKSLKKCRIKVTNTIHFGLIIAALLLVIMLIAFSIFIFAHTFSAFKDRRNHGVLPAMKKYKSNLRDKMIIDRLQIQFQCCGSKKYNEWFDIPWYTNTLPGKPKTEDCKEIMPSTRDDAPFSCCSRSTSFPCIHHSLMAVGSAYLYAPETNLSISEHGCQPLLLHWSRGFAWRTGTLLLLLAYMQIGVVVLQRLLQTAHKENLRFERTCYEHKAWVFGSHGGKRKCGPKPPPVPDDW